MKKLFCIVLLALFGGGCIGHVKSKPVSAPNLKATPADWQQTGGEPVPMVCAQTAGQNLRCGNQ